MLIFLFFLPQITTEARLPVDYITQRLQQLDKRLNRLEVKGRALEERIRSRKQYQFEICCLESTVQQFQCLQFNKVEIMFGATSNTYVICKDQRSGISFYKLVTSHKS
jgi:hypothetical protein